MSSIPWTYDRRRDTGTTNVRLGMWLFLASEAMLFASLFSAFVLLRTGSASWPDSALLGGWTQPALLTAVLATSTVLLALAADGPMLRRWPLFASAAFAGVFVALKVRDYRTKLDSGFAPSGNVLESQT